MQNGHSLMNGQQRRTPPKENNNNNNGLDLGLGHKKEPPAGSPNSGTSSASSPPPPHPRPAPQEEPPAGGYQAAHPQVHTANIGGGRAGRRTESRCRQRWYHAASLRSTGRFSAATTGGTRQWTGSGGSGRVSSRCSSGGSGSRWLPVSIRPASRPASSSSGAGGARRQTVRKVFCFPSSCHGQQQHAVHTEYKLNS